ncbi:MAG: hypothetical protein Q8P22_06335 [Chloroflexota bacterium]|nr:hypothetical protein [Chloroflexota bacterium]
MRGDLMRARFKELAALMATSVVVVAACTPVATPVPRSSPTPIPSPTPAVPARPPNITEAWARERGMMAARGSGPELGPGQAVRVTGARLMTSGEFDDRVMKGWTANDRSLPVWVVTVEGEWKDEGIVPPEHRRTWRYGVEEINAHTGEFMGSSRTMEPVNLDEMEGLDPASFPTYPLDVPLSYVMEAVDFPVSEPAYLPEGFLLERVVLDFANPVPEALPYPGLRWQAVMMRYADQAGKALELYQFDGGLPDAAQGAEKTTVQGARGLASSGAGVATWLAWDAMYPGPFPGTAVHVTYAVRSPDGSVSLDALRRVADSLPASQTPLPTPTAAPTPAATATPTSPNWPVPTATMTPTPTPLPSLVSEAEAVSRAIEHAQFCGLKGDPTGYVAQRMTLGEYDSLIDAGGHEPNKPVWVVSLRGEIEWRCPGPPSGPIALYVLVVDAETGNVTATSTYRHIENSPFAVPPDQPPLPTLTLTPTSGDVPEPGGQANNRPRERRSRPCSGLSTS